MPTIDIDALIEKLLAKHTDATGAQDPDAAETELANQGRKDPDLMEPELWASQKFSIYKKSHTLKPAGTASGQTVFGFAINFEAIVVLSEGKKRTWVRFKDMSEQRINMRQTLITKKAAESMSAAALEMQFWNQLRTKWDHQVYPNFLDFVQSL
jgi:hypothetical protein